MYQPSNRYPGFNGYPHRSIAEAAASFILAKHNIFACEDYYNTLFTDALGNTFHARKDFHHAEFNIDIEFKSSVLNSLKNTITAASAKTRFETAISQCRINKKNYMANLLKSAWSDSLNKQWAVQSQRPPASMLVIFEKMPSEKEQIRMMKKGLFFCTLGNIGNFLAMYRMLHYGVIESFSMCSHTFTLQPAQ